MQQLVRSDLLARAANGEPKSEMLRRLQALVDGASPDEVKALRRALFKRQDAGAGAADPYCS